MNKDKIVGHKTFYDKERGYWHEPLLESEANEWRAKSDAAKSKRADDMPDEQSAIRAMFDAWLRLKELGWQEAIYCPKDGTKFKVIEPGSTGIFDCYYSGEWPDGSWWILEDGDQCPSYPVLFKPNDEDDQCHE